MADNERKPGPSEYAQKQQPPPPRKTRFIFKFLGLILVALAVWIGSYAFRKGELPDVQDASRRQKMLEQAGKDFDAAKTKAVEVSGKFVSWAERGIDDLRARIKDKPPETKDDQTNLVNESKKQITQPPAPIPPPAPTAAPESKSSRLVAEARDEYRVGLAAYALTDPAGAQDQIQANLRKAEPHFSRALDLLEQARAAGAGENAIDALEQSAAKRLYDCRKRMAIQNAKVKIQN